jgi:acyl-homoserine lactone acylase PvdQ
MMKDSPLVPEKYADHPYLYNASRTGPRHQRGEMVTDLLDAATNVSAEQAISLAFNTQVWHAELWQERLKQAWSRTPESARSIAAAQVFNLVQGWNRRSDPDSEGALAYYAFKRGLDAANARATEPPASMVDESFIAGLSKAAEWLQATFGSLQVPFGKYFRVGREGGTRTWPVGGGSLGSGTNNVGMATPRAINFAQVGSEMVGRSGQTSTQIVILTNPPESYTVVPLGHSDDKSSGHWDDQAEKLFSKGQAAPTYFMKRDELIKHVTATKILRY